MSDPAVNVVYVYESNTIIVEAVPVAEQITVETETVILEADVGPQGPPGPAGPVSEDTIKNITPSGGYRITNIRMDANKRILITYEEDPVS